jgi:WhiB family redox-sensing transcriptional regulator
MRGPASYEDPLCQEISTELFFPELGEDRVLISQLKSMCKRCPHLQECAEWGIRNERFGIWGGLSAVERKRIRRKRGISLREADVA